MINAKVNTFKCVVNGKAIVIDGLDVRETLDYTLRYRLGVVSVHTACNSNTCGACTVNLDGRLVKSCSLFSVQSQELSIITVEGAKELYSENIVKAVNQAFIQYDALQCGFCTPAMLLSVYQLFTEDISPSNLRIRQTLSGNLCRCTGYQPIINAVELARSKLFKCTV